MTHNEQGQHSEQSITRLFIGTIGGAIIFSSAKVKDAIGRIGIFMYEIHVCDMFNLTFLKEEIE